LNKTTKIDSAEQITNPVSFYNYMS